MADSNKRTDRKSQGVRTRHHNLLEQTAALPAVEQDTPEHNSQSSRVTDMSWAAKYLDDEWEDKYSKKGGYDTKANAHPDGAGVQTRNVDMMSQTQEFRPLDSLEEETINLRDALTDKTAVAAQDNREASKSDTSERMNETKQEPADLSMTAALNADLADMGSIRDARSIQAAATANAQKMEQEKTAATAQEKPAPIRAAAKAPAPTAIPDTGLLNDMIRSGEDSTDVSGLAEKTTIIEIPKEKITKKKSGKKSERSKNNTVFDEDYKEVRQARPRRRERSYGYDDSYERQERRDRPRRRPDYPDRYYEEYDYPVKSPLRFIPLVLVIALCVLAFFTSRAICYDIPINASDYSKISYTVEEGLDNTTLSQDLMDLGLIDNPLVFRLRCIFYDADYVQGTYELSPCYSTEKIINILSGYKYGDDQ